MKTLGLLGGMSWVSTAEYYRHLNTLASRRGGNASCPCLIYSFEFSELADLMDRGEISQVEARLCEGAQALKVAGADAVMICTNTMHRHAEGVQAHVGIPVLHIVDALGNEIRRRGWQRVGVLGSIPTMTEPFYRGRLWEQDIACVVPDKAAQCRVHRAIFDELTQNRFTDETRTFFLDQIAAMRDQGAEACILGCTEIPLLLSREDAALPLIDSTACHCEAAFEWASVTLECDEIRAASL
jgi:aspartate racemase